MNFNEILCDSAREFKNEETANPAAQNRRNAGGRQWKSTPLVSEPNG